jgi:hypothetical protein
MVAADPVRGVAGGITGPRTAIAIPLPLHARSNA